MLKSFKTLYRGADILITIEPTAVLNSLFGIDELMIYEEPCQRGKSIILITHKLDEIPCVSDRVTVIRRGKVLKRLRLLVHLQTKILLK